MWVFIFLLSLAICFIRWIFWTVFSKPYRSLQFTLCVCVCVMRALSLNRVWFFYNPVDCSLPGSSVHRILQARILEWVAISSSRAFSHPRDWTHVSCVSCIGRQISFYHWATWEAFTRRILKTRKWRKVFQIPLISFSATLYLENDRNWNTETIVFFFFPSAVFQKHDCVNKLLHQNADSDLPGFG